MGGRRILAGCRGKTRPPLGCTSELELSSLSSGPDCPSSKQILLLLPARCNEKPFRVYLAESWIPRRFKPDSTAAYIPWTPTSSGSPLRCILCILLATMPLAMLSSLDTGLRVQVGCLILRLFRLPFCEHGLLCKRNCSKSGWPMS